MKILIKAKSPVNSFFLEYYQHEIDNISPFLIKMLKKRNVSFAVVDYISDLTNKNKIMDYKYDVNLQKVARGLMSDEQNLIAISHKNTKIDNIGAILYHELGHFIDSYKNYGNINSLNDLTFSSDKRFAEAYKKDFILHWETIKNDDNYRLIHFIQNSKPENISQTGIVETFAELYRVANNKINDTKTVELYFSSALEELKRSVNLEKLAIKDQIEQQDFAQDIL